MSYILGTYRMADRTGMLQLRKSIRRRSGVFFTYMEERVGHSLLTMSTLKEEMNNALAHTRERKLRPLRELSHHLVRQSDSLSSLATCKTKGVISVNAISAPQCCWLAVSPGPSPRSLCRQ